MFVKMSGAVALVALLSDMVIGADICQGINDKLESASQQRAATHYCASHLGITAQTTSAVKTVTKTVTKSVTTTTVVTEPLSTVTHHDRSGIFPSSTMTETLFTSTSTITSSLTGCAAPTSASKRDALVAMPPVLASLPSEDVSEACSCLSIRAATKTRVAGRKTKTVTTTTTITKTQETGPVTTKSVTPHYHFTTYVSTVTSTDYTTATTVTAYTGWQMLDGTNGMWAGTSSYSGQVNFDVADQSSATDWTITGNTLLDGSISVLGFPSAPSSGRPHHHSNWAWIDAETSSGDGNPISCQVTNGKSGTCGLQCSISGYSVNAASTDAPNSRPWVLTGKDPYPAFVPFDLYVVSSSSFD